jgi:hypothetical protein
MLLPLSWKQELEFGAVLPLPISIVVRDGGPVIGILPFLRTTPSVLSYAPA